MIRQSMTLIQNFEKVFQEYYELLKEPLSQAVFFYESVIIFYLIIANSLYIVIVIFGFLNARKKFLTTQLSLDKRLIPLRSLTPISILMPAYNEEPTVVESVLSMLRVNYPEFEVIVCNDGSKDKTIEILVEAFELYPIRLNVPKVLPSQKVRQIYKSKKYKHLTVIDKNNGGKSDALNAAINYSSFPLICCVDCDSLLDETGLMSVAMPFFEEPEHTIAVGGVIRIANDTKIEFGRVVETKIPFRWLPMIQIVEYLRSFLVGRMGWDYIGCNTIISGAFGLFKKSAVVAVGGYNAKTVGEDFELLLRMHEYFLLHRQRYIIKFLPNPVCWTETPEDFKTLGNQRSRWQQGLAESLWNTRDLVFNPKAGRIGMVALPYLWIFELISAPLEISGYIVLAIAFTFDLVTLDVAILFFSASMFYGITLTLGAIFVEELTFRRYPRITDFIKLCLGAILEQFGFRQLHLYWRLRGMYRWLTGVQKWGDMKRTGFKKKT